MDAFFKFASKFLAVFFGSLWSGISGFFKGIFGMFNIAKYIEIFKAFSKDFGVGEWILAILVVILLVAALAAIVFVVYLLIRKYVRVRKTLVSQEELLNEVGRLNHEVIKLSTEKERILAMKVSQIGLKPGESDTVEQTDEEEKPIQEGESRFYKLTDVDNAMKEYVPREYNNDITLPEICDMFRNFACSRMGLFYEPRIIRLFLAAFASTRLIILQGISGTGKTSLPYAFGKFLQNDANIASVQPSWRDRSELFGYFNEFTKRFNETETLKRMYEAKYTENIYLTILDEMNIARVEYYFAEMLSILEMPTRSEWVIDLVPSGWPNDPKFLENGRFHLPENMWYIGTANNDDSTFAISDKVYDRALPINIDSKGVYFEAPYTENLNLSFVHLEKLFNEAKEKFKVSEENLDKLTALDDYVIEHFRLAFGNRIVKQLREFVPAYVGCGGTEIDGIDYVLANKILRKFESLNLAFIRDEIDGLIEYLDEHFGQENMNESKSYLRRLQRLS
ncbi:MAG: hypothetical protein E7384_03780 [Ruminococcaceae bacterium]|nr:hypothetical protein [Oscillospiraceae bacterium]